MVRLGLPDADAAVVAALMAQADLQGSDGHGVSRLPQYARRIKAGGFNTRPNIRVVREQASTALVNGDNGMGHLVMSRAARNRDREGARNRHRLGQRAVLQPCRPRLALCARCRSPMT